MASRNKPQTLTLDHVSGATRLLEKRRQMFEVQEALDAQKEEFARREDAFRRREEGLRKKDLDLQDSLIKFNVFLLDNETKHTRAVKRTAEESRACRQYEAQIKQLKQKVEEMRIRKRQLQEDVNANKKFQKYLEDVLLNERERDFGQIEELLNRHRTLEAANMDLTQQQDRRGKDMEEVRLQYTSYTKRQTNEILNFNNRIASLQKLLEERESERLEEQSAADLSIKQTSDKTLELGNVLMAAQNLLQRCTTKSDGRTSQIKHMDGDEERAKDAAAAEGKVQEVSEQHAKAENAMRWLDTVGKYVIDYMSIVEDYHAGRGLSETKVEEEEES